MGNSPCGAGTHAQGPAGVATNTGRARGVGTNIKWTTIGVVERVPQLGADNPVRRWPKASDTPAPGGPSGTSCLAGLASWPRRCGRRHETVRSDAAVTRRRLAKGLHLIIDQTRRRKFWLVSRHDGGTPAKVALPAARRGERALYDATLAGASRIKPDTAG